LEDARAALPQTELHDDSEDHQSQHDTLTDREREVLVAVARGLSNTEIADTLFMSPATAKTHVSHLLTKLAVRDRAQLVMLAYEGGVVAPGVT
jgi:DNA-binding NarL/FixJ family response regulator